MDTGLVAAHLLMAIIYSMLSVISGALLELSDRPHARLPWGAVDVVLQPPEVHDLAVSRVRWVLINCSATGHQQPYLAPDNAPLPLDDSTLGHTGNVSALGYLVVTITSSDANIAEPYAADEWGERENRTGGGVVMLLTHSTVFAVQARNVGRAVFLIRVSPLPTPEHTRDDDDVVLSVIEYPVTVVRKLRLVDFVFDCAMAAIALLNSFSLGCLTHWPSIRKYIYQPTALLLSSSCNFLLLPMVRADTKQHNLSYFTPFYFIINFIIC
jgi:hypothetical protein